MNEHSPPQEQSPPRKLTRSRDDRYVGGVAAGLAKYLNVDAIFVRIAFIASLALGGLGLLVYGALLALTPIEGDPSDPLPPIESKRRNQMIGLAVIVGVVALFTADSGSFAAWVFGFWPGTVFGILFWVIAVGAAIWLLANGNFRRSPQDPGSGSGSSAGTGTPSGTGTTPARTETMPEARETGTFADSPTQVSPTRVLPDEPPRKDDPAPRPVTGRPDVPAIFGRIMLWFAIGLAALTAFCILFVISAGTTALLGGVPMSALVILLGGGMIYAGLRGRRQLSLWLLTAAVAVTIPMAAVAIADLRIEGSYGDINETPLSVLDIPDDGYEMAAGNMTIDLRKLDFARGRVVDIPVRSGMGLTSVIVPDRVCVTGEVEGRAGVISFRGRESNGIDVSQSFARPAPGGAPLVRSEVRLDAEFKLGAFEVVDSTQWQQAGRAGSFGPEGEREQTNLERARDRATAACSALSAPVRKGVRS